MLLILRALKCPPSMRQNRVFGEFTEAGGRIGRDGTCTLVLPDLHVSREHVEVAVRAGVFILRVTSRTNGILINDRRLKPGEESGLSDGDTVSIGEYVLEAALSEVHTSPRIASVEDLPVGRSSDNLSVSILNILNPVQSNPQNSLLKILSAGPMQNDDLVAQKRGLQSNAPINDSEPPGSFGPQWLHPNPSCGGSAPPTVGSESDIFAVLDIAGPADTSDHPIYGAQLPAKPSDLAEVDAPLPIPDCFDTNARDNLSQPQEEVRTAEWLLSVLGEAMGLAPGQFNRQDTERSARLIGGLLRSLTEGLHVMLDMRKRLKDELRIEDRTTIATRNNNPLKHIETLDAVLAYLVDTRGHAHADLMPPLAAVNDAMADLQAHQIAMMAGMRASLQGALKLYSPDRIKSRIKKSGALNNVIPALQSARLWEKFLEMHAELQKDAEDNFDQLLGERFSEAYAQQSRELKSLNGHSPTDDRTK